MLRVQTDRHTMAEPSAPGRSKEATHAHKATHPNRMRPQSDASDSQSPSVDHCLSSNAWRELLAMGGRVRPGGCSVELRARMKSFGYRCSHSERRGGNQQGQTEYCGRQTTAPVGLSGADAPVAPKQIGPWKRCATPAGRSYWLDQGMGWTRWPRTQLNTTGKEPVAHSLEPVEERQVECEAKAATAGILKSITIHAGVMVERSADDEKWLEAANSELDRLLATVTLRKAELKSAQAKGAITTPSDTVKLKARLVVCGSFLPQVPDTAAQNLDVSTMRLALGWGFAKGYRARTVLLKAAYLDATLKG